MCAYFCCHILIYHPKQFTSRSMLSFGNTNLSAHKLTAFICQANTTFNMSSSDINTKTFSTRHSLFWFVVSTVRVGLWCLTYILSGAIMFGDILQLFITSKLTAHLSSLKSLSHKLTAVISRLKHPSCYTGTVVTTNTSICARHTCWCLLPLLLCPCGTVVFGLLLVQ